MGRRSEEHPILVRDLLRSDGSRTIAFRVFCPRNDRSVSVSECEACPRCLEIGAEGPGANGRVCCEAIPPTSESLSADGAVGSVLRESIFCVESDLSVTSVVAVLVERGLSGVFVVDVDGRLLGLIRELDLVRSRQRAILGAAKPQETATADEIMSSAIAICEDTPVRDAIRRLARSHLRDAAIVARTGELVGVLRDVDGLRWIAECARRRR